MLSTTAFYRPSEQQGKEVALIIDGRFSVATIGFRVGHVGPEAAVTGGSIALLKNGDRNVIDATKGTIDVMLTDTEPEGSRGLATTSHRLQLRRDLEIRAVGGAGCIWEHWTPSWRESDTHTSPISDRTGPR